MHYICDNFLFFTQSGSFLTCLERQHTSPPSVIVVGGGISGIAAARALSNASFQVWHFGLQLMLNYVFLIIFGDSIMCIFLHM